MFYALEQRQRANFSRPANKFSVSIWYYNKTWATIKFVLLVSMITCTSIGKVNLIMYFSL